MNFKLDKRNKYNKSDLDENKSIKSNSNKLNESNLSI
jgi:hypothetical protein